MKINVRVPLLVLLSAAVLLAGCASRIAAYGGPRRPESQLALLPWDEAQKEIRIVRVDDHRIEASRATIEILPGAHRIEVVYIPERAVRSYPVQIRFNAEAGHRYVLSAKVLHGKVDGDGVWGGKYQAYVYDLIGAREVGRSEGPPSAPAERAAD